MSKGLLMLIPHLFVIFPACSAEPHAPPSEAESYKSRSIFSQSDSSLAEIKKC